MPRAPIKPLEELFRAKVINLLVNEKLLPPEQVEMLYSWKHSGFSIDAGDKVPPEATADLEALAQYILRNSFSVKKMTMNSSKDRIVYHSSFDRKINPSIKRNFEVFTPMEFLAIVTQHIPEKGAQSIRYFGFYSNKVRGMRQHDLPSELVVRDPSVSPPPLRSKRWRDLILRVWHVDPLRCPVCQNLMRVIAVINDRRVVEKILWHLGVCHDLPVGLPPPQDASGKYTYEPCLDVDPMPDYESAPSD